MTGSALPRFKLGKRQPQGLLQSRTGLVLLG